ncbi:MAG: S41 family peptidase [Bacteroidetes bacterium QH_8_67_23]|nr:MAG: S41 family peptidase [Bacteroidetes bacterium QH_8_67_23]
MKPRLRRARPALIALLALTVGATGGFLWPDDDFFALRKNFEIFGAVYEELATGYVEKIPPQDLMQAGVDAMLAELDPYTTYISEAESADLEIITRGRYGGVGLDVARRGGKLVVTAPLEGASGYEQGVRAGDVITQIDGQPAAGLSMSDVQSLLRGEPGTHVEIVIERAGAPQPLTFVLTRERVDLDNVPYRGFLGNRPSAAPVAYVKLERFTRTAAPEVRTALKELRQKAEAGDLGGVVLDLRDNPGGLLGAGVEVSGLFLEQGTEVVSTRGRTEKTNNTFRTSDAPLLPDVPLVILVNELSASASEIVAGAVQDHDRGLVVGRTTYGKGLVQTVRELPYNAALKMTTAQYFTPSGRTIQSVNYTRADSLTRARQSDTTFTTDEGRRVESGHGIAPDVRVAPPPPSPLEEALERRAAFFFFANEYAAEHPPVDASFAPSDETLAAFQQWLDAENVDYETDAERATDALATELRNGDYDTVTDEVDALRAALHKEKEAAFTEHASALKEQLREAILARSADKRTQVRASLRHDVQARRAAALLRDTDAYREALE